MLTPEQLQEIRETFCNKTVISMEDPEFVQKTVNQMADEIERLQKETREIYKQGRFDERMKWLFEKRTEETPTEEHYRTQAESMQKALEEIANHDCANVSVWSRILAKIAHQELAKWAKEGSERVDELEERVKQ